MFRIHAYKFHTYSRAYAKRDRIHIFFMVLLCIGYKIELTVMVLCVQLTFLAWLSSLNVFTGYRMSKTNSNHIINMRTPNVKQIRKCFCESHFSRLLFLSAFFSSFFSFLNFVVVVVVVIIMEKRVSLLERDSQLKRRA